MPHPHHGTSAAFPPQEHGGSIDIMRFVSSSIQFFLQHPSKMVLPDEGQVLPKLQGKVHMEKSNQLVLAKELVNRGVCCWVPLKRVFKYRNEPVLNGLFGVEKPPKTPGCKPILRLIMNLVPSNFVLKGFKGALSNLPHITAWMSTVLEEGEELRIWQSDMTNAFYLFRTPSNWSPYLSFNLTVCGQEIGLEDKTVYALACSVLPMAYRLELISCHYARSQREHLGERFVAAPKAAVPWTGCTYVDGRLASGGRRAEQIVVACLPR